MATGVQNAWSTTPATNATADSAINAREGWAPSVVNDSVRALMSVVKKWVLDWQGALVTGGSSTAYTLTTNETLTLADGVSVTCRMSATNGASPTLNVDSTGAVAIQSAQGTAVATGALLSGSIQKFTYYAASAAWIVNGLADPTPLISAASETVAGKVELATDTEAQTGTDTARAITPANLQSVTATATRKGVAELATDAEAITGTDTARVITPANVKAVLDGRTASASTTGLIELATAAEIATGTDSTRALVASLLSNHPLVPKAWAVIDATGAIVERSGASTPTSAENSTGNITVTWGVTFNSETYLVLAFPVFASIARTIQCSAQTTTTATFISSSVGSSPAAADPTRWCVMAFGTTA